jgi:hypothetical protein
VFLDALAAALAPAGLNQIGVVTRAHYDAAAPPPFALARLHPPAQSVVVIGSGGRAHWDRFLDWIARDPRARLAQSAHPLDTFSAACFDALAPLLDGCRVIFPATAPPGFDFMRLAELAGLAAPSELGILVSARFGPWLGLRAAVLAPHPLVGSPPPPRPCDGCPAPCRAACPVGVVGPGARVAGGFDWRGCVGERVRAGSSCRDRCGARAACILAPEAAYDALEQLYHYHRREGRRRLLARFGVADECSDSEITITSHGLF